MNQELHRRTLLTQNIFRQFQMIGESGMPNVVALGGQDIKYHYVIMSYVKVLKKQEIVTINA